MLIAQNLSKIYQVKERNLWFNNKGVKEVIAVKDISLQIRKGQIVGVLGVNGAGKTTTIRMLSTLVQPSSGRLQINNIDGIRYPNKVKEIVNVISGGERNLYWRLTARENLQYFGALYNIQRNKLKNTIDTLIKIVGLQDVADMPVERYSKGMKQRLQIARGLINDPDYLFLDEPTLGLDVSIARELRSYISDLATQSNKGILLTSHYISEIEELCNYVYIIDKGEVVAFGTPSELAKNTKANINLLITVSDLPPNVEKVVKNMVIVNNAQVEIKRSLKETSISISSQRNLTAEIVQVITNHDLLVLNLALVKPSLEDALIQFTSGGSKIEQNITNY